MKLNILFAVYIGLSLNMVSAQENKHNLTVGDYIPEFFIPKIINSKENKDHIRNYKDKLLIIDFWGTMCESCIEGMPKMDSLQKKFASSIKILPVTTENEMNVRLFWKNNKYVKKLSLPSVVEDKLFGSYFKYIYLGLQVWIYKGKVIGITSSDYVDDYNIQRVLNNEKINWPIVNDFLSMDRDSPLFSLDSRQVDTSSVIKYSIISGYKDDRNTLFGISRNKSKKTIRAFNVNQSILNVYISAWINVKPLDSLIKPSHDVLANQIVWEVKDKSKYTFINKGHDYLKSWNVKNAICFESIYDDYGQSDKDVNRAIIEDIDRLMGLHVRWEKKIRKVWVITKSNINYIHKKETLTSGHRYSLYNVVYMLNQRADSQYVFNESGIDTLSISLETSMLNDFSAVRKVLLDYGFEVKEMDREAHYLVFTETKNRGLFPLEPKEIDSIFNKH